MAASPTSTKAGRGAQIALIVALTVVVGLMAVPILDARAENVETLSLLSFIEECGIAAHGDDAARGVTPPSAGIGRPAWVRDQERIVGVEIEGVEDRLARRVDRALDGARSDGPDWNTDGLVRWSGEHGGTLSARFAD